jgi:hypothetical protein
MPAAFVRMGWMMATPVFNYGSDVSGLVWGFLLQGAAPAASVDAREAEAWLRAPVPGQFVWHSGGCSVLPPS